MGKAAKYIEAMVALVDADPTNYWTKAQLDEWANRYWHIRWDTSLTAEEKAAKLLDHAAEYKPERRVYTDEQGNITICGHLSADRYMFDELGWKQFDTNQDAWYFGIWLRPSQLRILTYGEGDVSLELCSSKAEYNKKIEELCKRFDPGFQMIACGIESAGQLLMGSKIADPSDVTVYRQDRAEFFLDEGSHA